MKVPYRFFVFFLLPFLCFLTLSYFVSSDATLQFDVKVSKAVYLLEHPFLTSFMIFISFIGSTLPVIVISLLLIILLYTLFHDRSDIILFVVASVGSVLLNIVLKNLFKRERPSIIDLVVETGFSYPSGHSMAAFSLYGLVIFLFWKHVKIKRNRILLLIFLSLMIITMGFSRVYLGVHYLTDVIGAYLISGCWLALTILGYQSLKEKQVVFST
ncbi:phosphatase PAP2 family protein [bacterium LRH843]|nr:phosphatase PAP2 family protein [bacterium LRH843]